MKVKIITRHAIANYGSLLQAIALQNKIIDLGHEAEIIDFIKDNESYLKSTLTAGMAREKFKRNPVLLFFYCIAHLPLSLLSDLIFEQYRKKYLNLTRRYTSSKQLINDKPIADVYMTGSDQVWGPVMDGKHEWSYFLDFCNDDDKKVAYAASFGNTVMSKEDEQRVKDLLIRYSHISVREDSAVNILNSFGISSEQVIDPTLLLTKNEWEQLLGINETPLSEKYILVYQIHKNKKLEKYAKDFSKKTGQKLVRVSPLLHQCMRGGKFIYAPSLGRFVSLIKNASYLITDSFHGTVFAINFNTPLVTMLPKTGTSSRNSSILRLMKLEECIVENTSDFSILDKKISFEYANHRLDIERAKSQMLLKRIIEE